MDAPHDDNPDPAPVKPGEPSQADIVCLWMAQIAGAVKREAEIIESALLAEMGAGFPALVASKTQLHLTEAAMALQKAAVEAEVLDRGFRAMPQRAIDAKADEMIVGALCAAQAAVQAGRLVEQVLSLLKERKPPNELLPQAAKLVQDLSDRLGKLLKIPLDESKPKKEIE